MADFVSAGIKLPGSAANLLFGYSVAYNGARTVMAVGVYGYTGSVTNQGGVFIYDLVSGSWVQRGAILTPSDAAAFARFGSSVALDDSGTLLAVGAQGRGTNNTGGVYFYDWSGSSWVERSTVLVASDAASFDHFGCSVALSNDGLTLAVGAEGWAGPTSGQGGVYFYDWVASAWIQRGAVLVASDATTTMRFGWSVAFSGDAEVLAVGAINRASGGAGRGGVYIFDRSVSTWTQRGAVIVPADIENSDGFGTGVALNDAATVLAIGSYGWEFGTFIGEEGVLNGGAVYIYDIAGSTYTQRQDPLTAYDAQPGDLFGCCVALDETGLFLAAGSYVNPGDFHGAIYFFETPSGPAPVAITPIMGVMTFSGGVLSWVVVEPPPDPPPIPPLMGAVDGPCCSCDCGRIQAAVLTYDDCFDSPSFTYTVELVPAVLSGAAGFLILEDGDAILDETGEPILL